jgi:hypothetical protein
VGPREPIDRERELSDAGRHSSSHAVVVHLPCAGNNATDHTAAIDLGRDLVPIVTQIELRADQRDLLQTEVGELVD